jgi:peptidoglycan DL-endopeptidase LytE
MFDDLGYPKEDGQTEREMLIEFQLDHHIISSRNDQGAGVYGPKTRATLESEHAKYISIRDTELRRIESEKNALISARDNWQAEYTIASKSVEMISTPKRGERGTHITALQTALKKTGYLKVRVNGVMNTSTIAALKSLQKEYKLTQSGSLDSATREALITALVEKV